jgi:hypothetical protein
MTASLPIEVLEAFRENPFAMNPEPRSGAQLYQAAFQSNEARQAADRLLAARDIERQLLIRSAPENFGSLARVPWEFLTATIDDRPIGLDPRLTIFRTIDVGKHGTPLNIRSSLRIAHILCNDREIGAFDEPAAALDELLSGLYERLSPAIIGKAVGTPRDVPALDAVSEILERFSPHVLLFVGHGREVSGQTELRFTQWAPINEIVTKLIASCRDLSLMMMIACDTAHADGAWETSLPITKLGVPSLLNAGLVAVCAMQAKYSAQNAVPFVELFLRSMFAETSLPAAFSHARRQAHLQSIFLDSAGWAVPLLFVNDRDVDEPLELHRALLAYGLEVDRQRCSFPAVQQPYVNRPEFDTWLDTAFDGRNGVAIIEAEAASGSTTSLSAMADRKCRSAQQVLSGTSSDALPRPFFYVDASAAHGSHLAHLLGTFGQDERRLIAGRLPSIPNAVVNQEINSISDLLRFIRAANCCLVIDHAWKLENSEYEELASQGSRLESGLILLVLRPGALDELTILRTRLLKFSQAECKEFAVATGNNAPKGELWWNISGGDVHRLRLLASDLLVGHVSDTQLDVKATIGKIEAMWPEVIELGRFCACFPQGVCRRWLASLGFEHEEVLNQGVGLGILNELAVQGLPWIRVSNRYGQELFEETGDREGGWLIPAGKSFNLVRRLVSLDELSVSPRLLREQRAIVETYRECAELFLRHGRTVGAEIAREVYEAQRPIGRHIANESLMTTLLGMLQMCDWQCGDLLRLAVSAQALGHTRLHGQVLDYVDSAGIRMTAHEKTTFLIQRASLLKDTAQVEEIKTIRELYGQAIDLINQESERADTNEDERRDFLKQAAHVYHNWGIAERYIGESGVAKEYLSRAIEKHRQNNNPIQAAKVSIEQVAAELDLRGETPDWETIERVLLDEIKLLDEVNASADSSFARYQLARLYKKMSSPNYRRAADAYKSAAEEAGKIGDLRLQGAAIKQYTVLAFSQQFEDKESCIRQLKESIAMLGSGRGDAWTTRVLRDAFAALALWTEFSSPLEAREAWQNAVDAAMRSPLRPDIAGGDRLRLAALFGERFEGLMLETSLDEVCSAIFGRGVSRSDCLAGLKSIVDAKS